MSRPIAPCLQKDIEVLKVMRLVLGRPGPDIFEILRLAVAMRGVRGAWSGVLENGLGGGAG